MARPRARSGSFRADPVVFDTSTRGRSGGRYGGGAARMASGGDGECLGESERASLILVDGDGIDEGF